jgi:DNA (cytosine-5)-methyltransferase 1
MKFNEKLQLSEILRLLGPAGLSMGGEALATVTHGVLYSHQFPNEINPYGERVNQLLGKAMGSAILNHKKVALDVPLPGLAKPKFKFIDLFAGIGGMRLAFQDREVGGGCVFTSEWDKDAQQTYLNNYGELPFGDITKVRKEEIPDHDVLVAGFPCQAFSIAGRRGGFSDTRGTLFFDVAETLQVKRPAAFLLENVRGLVNHDKGRTFKTILETLGEIGYFVPEPETVNARDFGVPQNRERIFIVGFAEEEFASRFRYPKPFKLDSPPKIDDVLEDEVVSSKYYLSTQYLSTLRDHRSRHEAKGNGFGYQVLERDQIANAIVVGGMGRERNLVVDSRLSDFTPVTKIKGKVNREGIRRMTPREWARLQGFPENFALPSADSQAYKQFGNSVAVPAVKATAIQILRALGWK